MKLFICETIEEYAKMTEYLTEQDQPVFVYKSDEAENAVLVSPTEIENIEEKITELLDTVEKDRIVDDDEPIWETGEDIPLDWFF